LTPYPTRTARPTKRRKIATAVENDQTRSLRMIMTEVNTA
jgi:hypothetical protein